MFRLLLAIELLQFCQANYITDNFWRQNIIGYHHIPAILYLLQIEISNNGVTALFMPSPTYRFAISEATDNITPTAVKSNSTIVEEPNSMVHPADLPSAAIPVSISVTSSEGDTIIGSWKGKHYSNEILKRRVAKMAVAPGYAPEVEHPSPTTAGYESQAAEEVTPESGQYGRRLK